MPPCSAGWTRSIWRGPDVARHRVRRRHLDRVDRRLPGAGGHAAPGAAADRRAGRAADHRQRPGGRHRPHVARARRRGGVRRPARRRGRHRLPGVPHDRRQSGRPRPRVGDGTDPADLRTARGMAGRRRAPRHPPGPRLVAGGGAPVAADPAQHRQAGPGHRPGAPDEPRRPTQDPCRLEVPHDLDRTCAEFAAEQRAA